MVIIHAGNNIHLVILKIIRTTNVTNVKNISISLNRMDRNFNNFFIHHEGSTINLTHFYYFILN